MNQKGIKEALTFDKHFRQMGFSNVALIVSLGVVFYKRHPP